MKKKLLLTGCTKGIGYAILKKLIIQKKYEIYALSKNINQLGIVNKKWIKTFKYDLENIEQTQSAAREILQISGGVDIIINNAGVGIFKNIEELTLEEWSRIMNINLVAPFILIKHLIPQMKKNNFGQIINITSDADHIAYPQATAYCASKFGLRGFSDSLRKEIKGYNIKVTTIAPGRVDTNFNNKKVGDRPNSLKAEDVANEVIHVLNQSARSEIESIYLNSVLEK